MRQSVQYSAMGLQLVNRKRDSLAVNQRDRQSCGQKAIKRQKFSKTERHLHRQQTNKRDRS